MKSKCGAFIREAERAFCEAIQNMSADIRGKKIPFPVVKNLTWYEEYEVLEDFIYNHHQQDVFSGEHQYKRANRFFIKKIMHPGEQDTFYELKADPRVRFIREVLK